MEVGTLARKLRRASDRLALPLAVAGLGAVARRTWRQWQADRKLLAQPQIAEGHSDGSSWPVHPSVSALVAAWNEAELIESHLASFLALSYPHIELVLCAGGEDGTYELAAPFAGPGVKVLRQESGEGKQRALGRCFAQATGEIIYLTDADCLFDERALLRLLEPLVRGEVKVATGVSEPLVWQREQGLVQYQWFIDRDWAAQLPTLVDGVLGRNCAITREALEQVGGFAAPVHTGTDYMLSRQLERAGQRIRGVGASRVASAYPASPADYLHMWRRWNKNLLLHGVRYRAWRDVRGVAIAAGVYGGIVLLLVLAPLVGGTSAAVALVLFATASANRVRRLLRGADLTGRRPGWQLLAKTPLYAALDMGAVLMAVHDAARADFRNRW